MSVIGGTPPFSWIDGTDLERVNIRSPHMCEAMQGLTNRANLAEVPISDWSAYDHDGTLLRNLGQTPGDSDLRVRTIPPREGAYRHSEYFVALREALESVLVEYFDSAHFLDTGEVVYYTLSTLLQDAVGRTAYNRTIQELTELPYFDGEDLEEILKCIDLLIGYIHIKGFVNGVEVLSYIFPAMWETYQRHFDVDGEGNPSENRAFAFNASTRSTVTNLIDTDGEMDFDFVSSGTNSSVQTTTDPPSQLSLDNLDNTGDTDFADTTKITFNLKCEQTGGAPGNSGATFNLHMPAITGALSLIISAWISLDSGTGIYSRGMQLKEGDPLITIASDIAVFGATASKDFDFKWTIGYT